MNIPCKPAARPPLRINQMRSEKYSETYSKMYNRKIYIEESNASSDSSIDEEQDEDNTCSDREENSQEHIFTHRIEKRHVNTETLNPTQRYNSKSIPQDKRNHTCVIIIAGVIILVCILCAHSSPLKKNSNYLEEDNDIKLQKVTVLNQYLKNIQLKFCDQKSDTWNDILFGMYNFILHQKKPLIINLFSTNTQTVNCLAKALGKLGGQIMGTNDYLSLTPEDFENDVGEVIHSLKPKIQEKRVTVVKDLLRINTGAIKAFHNFCDRVYPLVENTIYITTSVVDNYDSSKSEMEFIEGKLNEVYSKDIEPDTLSPLIARILDGAAIHVVPCEQKTELCAS